MSLWTNKDGWLTKIQGSVRFWRNLICRDSELEGRELGGNTTLKSLWYKTLPIHKLSLNFWTTYMNGIPSEPSLFSDLIVFSISVDTRSSKAIEIIGPVISIQCSSWKDDICVLLVNRKSIDALLHSMR